MSIVRIYHVPIWVWYIVNIANETSRDKMLFDSVDPANQDTNFRLNTLGKNVFLSLNYQILFNLSTV